MRKAMFKQWYLDAVGGLMLGLTNKMFKNAGSMAQDHLQQCTETATTVPQYADCMQILKTELSIDILRSQLNVSEQRQISQQPETRHVEAGLQGYLENQTFPTGHFMQDTMKGSVEWSKMKFHRRRKRYRNRHVEFDIHESISDNDTDKPTYLNSDNFGQFGAKFSSNLNFDKVVGGVRMDKIRGLMETIEHFSPKKPTFDESTNLLNSVAEIAKAFSDTKSQVRILSPTLFALKERPNAVNILSPDFLSLFNGTNSVLPWHEIVRNLPQESREFFTTLLLDLLELRQIRKNDTLKEKVDNFVKRQELLTERDVAQIFGAKTKDSIKAFDELQKSLSLQQWKEMSDNGFTWMNSSQINAFYSKVDADESDAQFFANLTQSEREELLLQELLGYQGASLEDFSAELDDLPGTPLVKVKLLSKRLKRQAPDAAIILEPQVFAPLILTPTVLGPLILSPALFSPLILSPQVLSPIILSPAVGSPTILSPLLLTPYVLSPQVLFPVVLSPSVLSPAILSPIVIGAFILSPSFLNPTIQSPATLVATVLSPCALGPVIESECELCAIVLSPGFVC